MLAYCAAAYWSATGIPEHYTNVLKYSTSCITVLRKCLDSAQKQPDFKVEELVHRLLRAEMYVKNLSGARIHMKYIRQLLKSKAEAGTLDPEALTMVMHTDNNLAHRMMSQPILESSWLQRVFAQSWNQADTLFPNHLPYNVDYRAPSVELQEILNARNKLFQQSSILRVHGSLINLTNWYWFASQREWLHNRLLHHYVNVVDEDRCDSTGDAVASSVDALLERCLVLGIGISLRYQQKEVTIDGKALLVESITLERRVAPAFAALEQIADKDWFRGHAQPIIWILFMVALIEYKIHSYSPAIENETPWLIRLRYHIKEAGLKSWPELVTVLARFPYAEQELPLPYEDWLNEAFTGA